MDTITHTFINILCPNHNIPMQYTKHQYSWKDGKPVSYIVEYQCPDCYAIIRIEMPVIYWKV